MCVLTNLLFISWFSFMHFYDVILDFIITWRANPNTANDLFKLQRRRWLVTFNHKYLKKNMCYVIHFDVLAWAWNGYFVYDDINETAHTIVKIMNIKSDLQKKLGKSVGFSSTTHISTYILYPFFVKIKILKNVLIFHLRQSGFTCIKFLH